MSEGFGPEAPGFEHGRQAAPGGYPPQAPPGYSPPAGYAPVWYPPNPPKGWEFGLPPTGPGSVAPPVKRLLARLLDGASSLSWIGLLDYLWCLWDANGQCVHDKIVDTVVVTDL